MRHFYAEWSRRMGRPAYDPFREQAGNEPARGRGLSGAPWSNGSTSRSWSTARASRSTTGTSRPSSSLCDEGFRYKITTYSPEIRKEMVWLDHDKQGMETLFTQPAAPQQRPFAAHAPCHRVHGEACRDSRPRWSRRCRCSAPRSTAAPPSSSRSARLRRHGEARRRRAEARRSAS